MTNTHALQPGVYAPVVTPFFKDAEQNIDVQSFAENISRLAKAGVGIVVGGTLGEGAVLGREEVILLIKTAREVIQREEADGARIPLIAGIIGVGSVTECVHRSIDAAKAGADAV
jgi:dihydrodipicolinate synthase/N-acetylneuraminate lyase